MKKKKNRKEPQKRILATRSQFAPGTYLYKKEKAPERGRMDARLIL